MKILSYIFVANILFCKHVHELVYVWFQSLE
jgi:hypothetical protein